jgi:hypothetical protein
MDTRLMMETGKNQGKGWNFWLIVLSNLILIKPTTSLRKMKSI